MGKLVLAAKITHVPSMYLSELEGPHQGCRQAAIDGHIEIGKRCRELDVDIIVVFDSHWLVNSAFHINCGEHFEGVYTSNELPHFIKDMPFAYDGNPVLGQLMQEEIAKTGVRIQAHNIKSLELEYGTLVPMRYMNQDRRFKVVSVSAFCTSHSLQDSRKLGEGLMKAIERYEGNVAIFASGSLSHRFIWDWEAHRGMDSYTREWDRQVDKHVVNMWENAEWAEFCAMLPEYAEYCFGEGGMHDTAMLLGAMGWDSYNQPVEIITPAFPSSGTGQINAIFPLMPAAE
ncbi:3,4-dihydroxyphenylacetate 2,3-dioxygenase [Acinetobacter sp. MB5]|uniref:3,4-dihydroxyphenylacetate 2,3-dioxygenase n=1 Tax=Acinetobacter sp. MB5 TaxID=2069438 RepID=UPI000DD0E8B2|nr:3,4-dihydroxyphenylacetate 2,3-dioxygenase [Acinetobacter sp. MB5]